MHTGLFLNLDKIHKSRNVEAALEFFNDPRLLEPFEDSEEELKAVADLQAHGLKLLDFDRRLREAKGISRGMALELKELIPDLQNFHIRGFTEEISLVGYESSLENMQVVVWTAVVAIVTTAVLLIRKFIGWLSGSSSGGGGSSGSISAAKEGVKQTQKNFNEQTKALAKVTPKIEKIARVKETIKVPSSTNHSEISNSHIAASVKEDILSKTKDSSTSGSHGDGTVDIVIDFSRELNAVVESADTADAEVGFSSARLFFGRERNIEFIKGIFQHIGQISKEASDRVNMLEKMVTKIGPDGALSEKDIEEFERQINNYGLVQGEKSIDPPAMIGDVVINNERSLSVNLKSTLEGARNIPIPKQFEVCVKMFEEGCHKVNSVEWDALQEMLDVLAKSEKVMEDVEVRVKKYLEDATKTDSLERKSTAFVLNTVATNLRLRLTAMMTCFSHLSGFYSDVARFGHKILKAFAKHVDRVIAVYHKFGASVDPALLRDREDVEAAIKFLEEHPVHRRFLSDSAFENSSK